MRILIAEDEKQIVDVCEIAIKAAGHNVAMAADGEEAVRIFESEIHSTDTPDTNSSGHAASSVAKIRQVFDLVLLDIGMPKIDGLEAAKRILGMVPFQRVMIMTAFGKEEIAARAAETLSQVEVLQKPFELSELIAAIEKRRLN